MNEFIEWLNGLETQTLTDELKDDIIEKFEEAVEASNVEAYADGKTDAIEEVLKAIDKLY